MTIEQLLNGAVGEKTGGGFVMSIKTFKKTWETEEGWFQQIILMDKTGEMPADVFLGKKYDTLRGKGNQIKIIVCEIQEAEYLGKDRKKLYIDQYATLTQTVSEYEARINEAELARDIQVKGMVRHGLVCSFIRASKEINKPEIENLVEYIVTGK